MTDFPTGLLFNDAMALLREVAARHRLETDSLALPRCHGRVLVEDVDAPVALPIFDMVLNAKTVRGSIVGTRKDLQEALEFAAEGKVLPPAE